MAITSILVGCQSEKNNPVNSSSPIKVELKSPSIPEGGAYFTISGSIEPEHFASLSTRNMGYVSKVYAKVGDKVKKGQLLIDINSDEIDAKKAQAQAGLKQAEAQLAVAQKNFERYTALFSENSASQKELDDITLQYEIAMANYERALQIQNEIDAMMAYSHIRAPFSGVITSKTVKMGDMAQPGQTLMSLEAPGKFVARALVPESSIESVVKGQQVTVFVKSLGKSLKGIISEVSGSSQNSGGQYLIKIDLEGTDDIKLFSGMYVSVLVPVTGEASSSLFVDKSALIQKGELDGIYTVSESGTAILRWLKLGQPMGDQVEVLSGLSQEEKYIASSEGKLFNGAIIANQE
jgi:RND family efflux transporter MFP subunit